MMGKRNKYYSIFASFMILQVVFLLSASNIVFVVLPASAITFSGTKNLSNSPDDSEDSHLAISGKNMYTLYGESQILIIPNILSILPKVLTLVIHLLKKYWLQV
jgi:hypothetical protein